MRLHGCSASTACTILIPEHGDGAAPTAGTIGAREVIDADQQFRSITAKPWPFDASAETHQMPDMLHAIMTPAR